MFVAFASLLDPEPEPELAPTDPYMESDRVDAKLEIDGLNDAITAADLANEKDPDNMEVLEHLQHQHKRLARAQPDREPESKEQDGDGDGWEDDGDGWPDDDELAAASGTAMADEAEAARQRRLDKLVQPESAPEPAPEPASAPWPAPVEISDDFADAPDIPEPEPELAPTDPYTESDRVDAKPEIDGLKDAITAADLAYEKDPDSMEVLKHLTRLHKRLAQLLQ